MSIEKIQFWMPYITQIPIDQFAYNEYIVRSKHYAGADISNPNYPKEYAVSTLNMILKRVSEYKEIIAKPKISIDDMWYVLVTLIDKSFIDDVMIELINTKRLDVSDEEFWDVVVSNWTRQEFNTCGQRAKNWRKIFAHRPRPSSLTSGLPETFTAYRAGKPNGFSWSLSKEKALWFHRRFATEFGNIPFLERKFKRCDAEFYTNSRGEQEVVILPKLRAKKKVAT